MYIYIYIFIFRNTDSLQISLLPLEKNQACKKTPDMERKGPEKVKKKTKTKTLFSNKAISPLCGIFYVHGFPCKVE